jgi:trehalose utilization protein
MRTSLLLSICFIASTAILRADPIHVLVWDERQPRQAEAYDNFLGNEIVARLKSAADDLELRSVALDDPEQGLSAGNLEWADVIVWWGHARHSDVTAENAQRIVDYIRRGELDLIALQQFPVASEVFCFSVKNAAITAGVS